ncbi:TIGR02281 family clan AA aspartic protease [Holosporaceae bacterium 'Namur']|nr:TIGR02281 family clan AA aspartic protease [Holosporaceae bacterium 'Namur']
MQHEKVEIVRSILVLMLIIASFIAAKRYKNIPFLKYSLYWVAIFIFFGVIYTFKNAAFEVKEKMAAELIPGYAVSSGGQMVVKKADNGHFYLYLNLNGKTVRFMVDTGATNVSISKNLAQEIGISTENLKFIYTAYTANGVIRTANAIVREIELGDFKLNNFTVSVSDYDETIPLLGMSFLNKFKSYEFRGDSLYLKY